MRIDNHLIEPALFVRAILFIDDPVELRSGPEYLLGKGVGDRVVKIILVVNLSLYHRFRAVIPEYDRGRAVREDFIHLQFADGAEITGALIDHGDVIFGITNYTTRRYGSST